MTKTKLIGLNWKMNPLIITEVRDLVREYNQIDIDPSFKVIVFVPSVYLFYVRENLKSEYIVGAQDIGIFEGVGAYTGEISGQMISALIANYALIGHSETRQNHLLSEIDIISKLGSCSKSKIKPILCVGYGQKDENIDLELIRMQVESGLENLDESGELVIAFEPVGSIGTGEALGIEEIIRVVNFVKDIDPRLKVIYGGSVNSKNFDILNGIDILDGLLIGGMSLKPKELSKALTWNQS
jgi:triosephosphate isomerase (TIM)